MYGAIPLDNESINSVVVDLPFVIAKGPSLEVDTEGQNIILKRFGVYYPALQMYQSYLHWIREVYRVLKKKGICVFKTQATVSGGVYHDTPRFATMVAESAGFILDDEFILTSRNRINSGAVKNQQHSRRHHCSFLVFKKLDGKKYDAAVYDVIMMNILQHNLQYILD
ncbi:MAG: site-specific DNA-methyltransferase [Bacteroidales bacterium]|nr:site-specific DNA-methyltransferase [Bacteroidales bacterium]